MSGEFTYVSRTRKTRRNKNRQPEIPSLTSIQDRFESTHSTFITSAFCARCSNAIRELLNGVPSPERIVCLGLGSLVNGVTRGRQISEIQLALLVEFKNIMNVPIVAYDPIFASLDVEFLQSLGINVESSDKEYDCTSLRTLFYLPHCDRSTNETVIANLIATGSLEKAILLGNDLRNYANTLTDTQFKTLAPNILKVVEDELLEWKILEPKYGEEYWDAFSDLCLIWPRQSQEIKT